MKELNNYNNRTSSGIFKQEIYINKSFNFNKLKSDSITIISLILELFYPNHYQTESAINNNVHDKIRILKEIFGEYLCEEKSNKIVSKILLISSVLDSDIDAIFEGDPAAKSKDEIIISYPGFFAIAVYRIANILYNARIELMPRIMSEYAHSKTGIDIHPGAQIEERFFIDHGTGIVIGETCVIGKNVKLYQGVTLGAISVPNRNVFEKRHPTIMDNVTIYSGATILGGDTVIGEGSIIGGNAWITKSIPAYSKVINISTAL